MNPQMFNAARRIVKSRFYTRYLMLIVVGLLAMWLLNQKT